MEATTMHEIGEDLQVQSTPLTKEDVKAARMADTSICFDHVRGTTNSYGTGQGRIRCHKEVKKTEAGPYASQSYQPDMEYTIHCFSRMKRYSDNHIKESCLSGYCYMNTWSDVLKTLVAFVREGDTITLEWSVDGHRNQYAESMQMHVDALYVVVSRGKANHTFLMDVGYNPGNTARMIQY